MSWKDVAYLDEVATLSDNTPQAITAGASGQAGTGGAAARDDHVHASPSTWPPTTHKAAHEDGGGDEISVAGLSGLLADGQTPLTHATSHKSGGGDAIKLNEFAVPDGAVDFNQQEASGFVPEKATGSLGTGVDGQVKFFVDDDHLYCYVA